MGLRIEISGGIASGKTTLASLLATSNFVAEFEDFRANPFWFAFYEDPIGNAFETELTFFLQHYHGIKRATSSLATIACDHSLLLDLAYARVTLGARRLSIFEDMFSEVWNEIGPPTALVHLRCDASTELFRIRRRARPIERAIDVAYLGAINASLQHVIDEYRSSLCIVEIDSAAINFAEMDEGKCAALRKIGEVLGQR